MRRVVWFILFLLLVSLVSAVDYPSPKGYVSDYADIIDVEYESQIESLLTQLEQETTVEVAVLTVEDFQGLDRNTYAVEIFEEWGIGKKDVDNGLLILVGLEEGEWRIEVGYGLEGLITDSIAGRIGRNNLVPNFQEGEFGKGIYEAVLDIKGFVEGEGEVISQYVGFKADLERDFDYFYSMFFIALIIGGIVGLVTKKIKDKKIKWGVKLGIGILVSVVLIIFWSYIVAIMFFVLFLFLSGGKGGFLFFMPGFRGGGGGRGFGGFGGGLSGGGGAGGRW